MKQIDLEPHEWNTAGKRQPFWGPNWLALPMMLLVIAVATTVKIWTSEPKDPNVLLERDGVRIKILPDAPATGTPYIKKIAD